MNTATSYEVEKKIPHPDYIGWQWPGTDIGLLKLTKNIKLGSSVQIIQLGICDPPNGEEVAIVGFGAVKCLPFTKNYTKSNHLRTAVMTVKRKNDKDIIYSVSEDGSNTCYVRIAYTF